MSQQEHAAGVPPAMHRPVLGFVTDFIGDSCRGPAWLGFVRGARKLNVHQVTFIGYRPDQDLPAGRYIYDLANGGLAHGLALNLRACERSRYDGERRFLSRFAQRPILALGRRVPEFPCLTYDHQKPLSEAVTHLVNVHGRKRIAFFAADPAWDHADGRTETFRRAMRQLNVEVDESLIVAGTQERADAAEAVRRIFGAGTGRPEAVIACSDRSAYQVVEELLRMGIAVPDEVAVVGCDDLPSSRFFEPPLTTVALDEQAMGAEAARVLMDWLIGKAPPQEIRMPARLAVRESCGCYSPLGHPVAAPAPAQMLAVSTSLDDVEDRLKGRVSATLRLLPADGEVPACDVERLLRAFTSGLRERDPDRFLRVLLALMRAPGSPQCSPWIWLRILLDLKEETSVLPLPFDEAGLAPVLLDRGLRLVHGCAWRRDRWLETRRQQNWAEQRPPGLSLMRAQNLRDIQSAAAGMAKELGIERYAVCVDFPTEKVGPDVRVCLAGRAGQAIELEQEGKPLEAGVLIPDFIFPGNERKSILFHPLNVTGLKGYMLLEQSTEDWVAYHTYAEHLGAALHSIRARWVVAEQATHLAEMNARMRIEVRERRQAEERLAASVSGLRGILLAANELVQVNDEELFFRRAVELAREQLGVERCGLWVPMPGTDKIRGTFGTNRQGRTVDESYVVRPKGPGWLELERIVTKGEPHWVKLAGHPHIHVEQARVVEIGHGWVVATPIFGGRRLMGAFFNDTALSGAPLDESRQELVFVYGAMLGNLMLSRRVSNENGSAAVGG